VGDSDDYHIEQGEQIVRVGLHCRLSDAGAAERLLREVDDALARTGFDRVLFDYRGVDGHAEEVREAMWTWAIDRGLRAVALLVDGEMTRVRTNMTAVSRKMRLRAFMDEDEAREWLRDPNRRTREVPQV
jgi:hypothetical protein